MQIAEIKFSELPQEVETPIIQYCRNLLEKKVAPDTILEIYREERKTPDVIVRGIGNAAKLRVTQCKFKVDTKYLENIREKVGSSPVH